MLWKKLSSNLGNVIPAGDPYYANVVLLLHGDGANGGSTFIDSSQYNRTPFFVSEEITTSNEEMLFGQNTIKSTGGAFVTQSVLEYSSSIDFTRSNNFTLEFWINSTQPYGSQPYFMARSAVSYSALNQLVGYAQLSFTNWGSGSTNISAGLVANTWHYVVLQQSGSDYRIYLDGNLVQAATNSSIATPTPEKFGIVNVPDRGDLPAFTGYLSEIRYTQGVARYSGSTIPVQSAPWPNST
jgi:hypothetical protein